MIGTALADPRGPVEPPLTVPPAEAPPSSGPFSSTSSTPAQVTAAPVPAPASAAPPAPATPHVAEPVRLRIPSIGVDSELLHLGLNPDGTLEVPPRGGPAGDMAAWYDGSPRPGEEGPAVLEGHVDSMDGPSVFYRLGELAPGDRVLVDRADGTTATFVVDTAERYPKDDFPTVKVYGSTPDAQIRLITCGGDFDRATGHYVDNTVVYGHLVRPDAERP